MRTQYVARRRHRRNAVGSGDLQTGAPGPVEEKLLGVARHRGRVPVPVEAAPDLLAQQRRRLTCLGAALVRHLAVQNVRAQRTRRPVLQAVQQPPQHPERRRHHTARVSGVRAVAEDPHVERPAAGPAQRRDQPQPFVVARTGVQADHQAHLADARREQGEPVVEVGAARLLTGLEHADAARPGRALLGQRPHRGHRRGQRVPVVGAPAAVQTGAVVHRLPSGAALGPPVALGLLVEVPVEQDGLLRGRALARYLEEDQRRASGRAQDLHPQAGQRYVPQPRGRRVDGPVEVAVGLPVGVVRGADRRDADVLPDEGEHLRLPLGVTELPYGAGLGDTGGGLLRHRRGPVRPGRTRYRAAPPPARTHRACTSSGRAGGSRPGRPGR